MMRYTDEDIEFAGRVLTQREELEDETVQEWMDDPEHVRLLDELAGIREHLSESEYERLEKGEFHRLEQAVADRKSRRMTLRWSVAASIILLIGVFLGRGVNEWRSLDEKKMMAQSEKIVPGQVKAELVLADGKSVLLGGTDKVIEDKDVLGILNDSLSGLTYKRVETKDGGAVEDIHNTLRVPRGGFYLLELADGTKVWLNSESELRYPVVFVGESRVVDLKGEAYFEVAKDNTKPFHVRLNEAEVTVLGTSFNVNTYGDDGHIYTTLVEGSVRMISTKNGQEEVLKPGMQSVMNVKNGHLKVREVDVEPYVAWRDGKFVFRTITLGQIMSQLQRWYDFNVFYQNAELKDYEFRGMIKRDMELDQVLEVISATTNVDFEVKGKVVTIIKR